MDQGDLACRYRLYKKPSPVRKHGRRRWQLVPAMTYSATLAHNLRMFSCAMKAISGSLNQRDQFDLMRHTLQLHADDPARVAAVNDFIDGVQIGMGCAGTILRSWLLENAPASSDFDPASAQKTVERYDWQDRKDLS